MRVLVTGSRTWSDTERLWWVMDSVSTNLAKYHKERFIREGFVLVSGHARGVDQEAERWYADRFPLETPELWPANWKTGRSAGIKRNITMVETNPDLCVAFIAPCVQANCHQDGLHGSHGATQCADYAENHGVQTTRYYAAGFPHVAPWGQVRDEMQAIRDYRERQGR